MPLPVGIVSVGLLALLLGGEASRGPVQAAGGAHHSLVEATDSTTAGIVELRLIHPLSRERERERERQRQRDRRQRDRERDRARATKRTECCQLERTGKDESSPHLEHAVAGSLACGLGPLADALF
jgi:hypothetical protein